MNFKKSIAFIAALSLTAVISCGCGTEKTDSSSSQESSAVEETTEETSVAETEPETTEEPEIAIETEEPEIETESETEEESVITNAELVSMINSAFGIYTDKSVEADIKAAVDWDIIDEDTNPEDAITAEFLVSAVMRATGFVNGESSLSDIVVSALERGVIEDLNLANLDLNKASEVVEKGAYAWIHQEFKNEVNIQFADGVIDLTDVISPSDYTINGDEIELPEEYYDQIEPDSVIILPKDASTGEGGAYKVQSIVKTGDGKAVVQGTVAEIQDLYSGATFSGSFEVLP